MPDSYNQPRVPFPSPKGVSTFNEGTSWNREFQPTNGPSVTPPTTQEDSIDKMWSAYLKEANEHDKFVTDLWRKDTSGVLFFVSFSSLISEVIVLMASKGWSTLRNRCCLSH